MKPLCSRKKVGVALLVLGAVVFYYTCITFLLPQMLNKGSVYDYSVFLNWDSDFSSYILTSSGGHSISIALSIELGLCSFFLDLGFLLYKKSLGFRSLLLLALLVCLSVTVPLKFYPGCPRGKITVVLPSVLGKGDMDTLSIAISPQNVMRMFPKNAGTQIGLVSYDFLNYVRLDSMTVGGVFQIDAVFGLSTNLTAQQRATIMDFIRDYCFQQIRKTCNQAGIVIRDSLHGSPEYFDRSLWPKFNEEWKLTPSAEINEVGQQGTP